MGVKKLVTITVEAKIEIEMADWAANPTSEDIKGVNECGYDVENSDDIFKHAAASVLRGHKNCNLDVYGFLFDSYKKINVEKPDTCTFYNLKNFYIVDCEVEDKKE